MVRSRAVGDFDYFLEHIFSASFDRFVDGPYIHDVAEHLSASNFTMDVTGRDHFKSTRLYADIMYALICEGEIGFEAHYFSYTQELASYHLAKIKDMIARNPYYAGITDHKTRADGVVGYSWNGGPRMTVKPAGLLTFKRGIHADRIYIDDALRDPENKMKPTLIMKINRVMKAEVLSMVNKGGVCRIVGTPQTPEDFFFDPEMQKRFKTWITAAIVDEINQVALWPEWKSYTELVELRHLLGEKIFNQEYMASPVYAEESYIDRDRLYTLSTLKNRRLEPQPDLLDEIVVAGFDIGKKVHPSHLAVFIRRERDSVITYQQVFGMWLDGWDYLKQVELLNTVIDYFNITRCYYDNTRGEFEGFAEQNKLHTSLKPVVLGAKNQAAMAAHFGAVVDRGDITLINEARQINQILAMNNDLQAIEGPEGHADSYWSIALALYEKEHEPNIRFI